MHRQTKLRGIGSSSFLLILVALCAVAGYLYAARPQPVGAPSFAAGASPSALPAAEQLGFEWPPRVGERFPDMTLVSATGEAVSLSDFEGRVILVEPVGMTCPACNAFAGAHQVGGFGGVKPQRGLPSIEELLPSYARGVTLDHEDLVLVYLLLFDTQLETPSADDARQWSEHFGCGDKPNVYVMAADERFMSQASYDMVPGFFLVDRDFVLRADSTGHHPQHDLFQHLLPMVPDLIES